MQKCDKTPHCPNATDFFFPIPKYCKIDPEYRHPLHIFSTHTFQLTGLPMKKTCTFRVCASDLPAEPKFRWELSRDRFELNTAFIS